MAKKELSYKEALTEVEAILGKMQNGDIDIDQLEQDVKKVSQLIAFCKEKLRSTEERVNSLLEEENE